MPETLKLITTPSPAKGLKVRRMGIDTHQEPIVYLKEDNFVCRAEGFAAMSRVLVQTQDKNIIASLNVTKNSLLQEDEVGLSEVAWKLLAPKADDLLTISHTRPIDSFATVRGKLFGKTIPKDEMFHIITDIVAGRYTQIQLSAFILACIGDQLNLNEMCDLTEAMVKTGDTLSWDREIVVDKHCVGGLPGNRTTPIVVAVVAACGLLMPKTSSRAITSPAGTADTMEVITPVNLTLEQMKKVVEKEGGCIAWGGKVNFSPSDDKLIQIERALDLDSEGQMVPSILSKKLAAGATHVVIDIPVGATAKVRSMEFANRLGHKLSTVGKRMGIQIFPIISDGSQPIGYGVGPALEMRDILNVLQNQPEAPADLKIRSCQIAGRILEMSKKAESAKGFEMAEAIIDSGQAWQKFKAICEAQGGMKELPKPLFKHEICATRDGIICYFNNRFIAKLAKLAGAPNDKAAGLYFDVKLGDKVSVGDRLFTIYSESQGELQYALDFLSDHPEEIQIGDELL